MNDRYMDLVALFGMAVAMANYDMNKDIVTTTHLEKVLEDQTDAILQRVEEKLDIILKELNQNVG